MLNLALALILALSATPGSAASSSATRGIEIKKVGSAVILIGRTRLKQTKQGLELEGHVLRNSGHEDTSHSHLMIKVYNAEGEKLREIPTEFNPRQIPHHIKMLGSSTFKVAINLPAQTVQRIEIAAYEEN